MNGVDGYKVRTIVCVRCKTEITKRMPAGRKYCSTACYRSGPRPQRKTGENRACERCGTAFYVTPCRPAHHGRFCSPACHNAEQGKTKTEHTCKTCDNMFRWSPSRTASGNYRITYCSLSCRDADPARRAHLLAMNTAQQAGRTTRVEVAGYALLDRLDIKYTRQTPFAGKFTPDATIAAQQVVVQFDGDYWHDRTKTSTEPRIQRRVRLDLAQDAYLRACGWQVVRLWESELRDDPESCAERVRRHLRLP